MALLVACAGAAAPEAGRAQAPADTGAQTAAAARPVEPAPVTRASIYDLQLAVDLPLMLASGTVGASWLLSGHLAPPDCAPRCDDAALPMFDRGAAGRHDLVARRVSDVGVATVMVGSAALLWIDGGLVDLAIGTEAVLATSAVAVLTMFAVRRPRPFVYGDDAPLAARLDGNAALAFPSGHTANAFAATLAAFHSFHARHPSSPWPWIALGGGLALSSGVGVSRVLAGDHFPSDVLAGAVLGTTIGWLVPELHRVAPRMSIAPGPGTGLAVSGSF
jgi:membrane-associated phospholipid phosphatase